MNIGIVGPAGSGKGTHATNIANRYGLVLLKVGDALRDEVRTGSQTGKIIAQHQGKGIPTPSKLVVAAVKKQFEKYKKTEKFLIDSAPYNFEQVQAFEEIGGFDYLILLDFKDFTPIFERLGKRRICPKCHVTTSIKEAPNEVCPACGGELEIRHDDKPEVIKNRLQVFESDVRPVAEYYKKQNKLINVNGDGTIEQVWARITEAMDKILKNI